MFAKNLIGSCQVARKLTDNGQILCLKPATVALLFKLPGADVTFVCPECARELAKEIVDSVPGGRLDADVVSAAQKRKGTR